jgi:Sulfotransferase family
MALYGRNTPHAKWSQWRDLNPVKFHKYFKFALIRHPIPRFVSAFNFLKSGGMNAQDQQIANSLLAPFANPSQLAKAMMDYLLQEQILRWWHFRPRIEFVADNAGRPQVDLLVRSENIDNAFTEILRRLNQGSVELPHSTEADYRAASRRSIDQEASDVLLAIYRRDLILWQEHGSQPVADNHRVQTS